jgi:nucleoside-diphosphate kinase
MCIEETFIMIKPDGIQRGLLGKIISRFEKKGLKLIALKMMHIDKNLAEEHYFEHIEKPFYKSLIEFITSGPIVAGVLKGEKAINIVRKLVGATSPNNAELGTIRGDFAINTGFNIIHASDSSSTAKKEIDLFFQKDEIFTYDLALEQWLGSK